MSGSSALFTRTVLGEQIYFSAPDHSLPAALMAASTCFLASGESGLGSAGGVWARRVAVAIRVAAKVVRVRMVLSSMRLNQPFRYLLKWSMVRCQERLAAFSSKRGVVSLWKPWLAP